MLGLDLDLRVFNLSYDEIERMMIDTGMVHPDDAKEQLNIIGKKLAPK